MDAGSIIVDQGICESVRIKDAFASRKESESTMPIEMFINVFVEAAAILSRYSEGMWRIGFQKEIGNIQDKKSVYTLLFQEDCE